MMRQQLQHRLEALHDEFEKGQSRLREMQLQQSQLQETLLRISGAIQILSELLEKEASETQNGADLPRSVTTLP
jgi:predicted nuclease with TOPRIM domain